MQFFLSSSVYRFLIPSVVLLKVIGFFYFAFISQGQLFGGGSDAGYYNQYALGFTNVAVNYWPVIMRFFNDLGLYDRDAWKVLLFFISIVILPFLFFKIIKDRLVVVEPVAQASVLLVLFYPTIFFFSIDVYRDVFMYAVFLLTLWVYRNYTESNFLTSMILLALFFLLCYFLYLLRPYLGASLALSFVAYLFYARFSNYIKTWILLYIVFLMLVKASGILDAVLEYRGVDGFVDGGTSLGIGLLDRDPVTFLFFYIYSFLAQVFGVYIVNPNTLLVFVLESIPFILALVYVLKNLQFITAFGKFLLVFFVIYTTIWVMGNDNLGTAVRLRVPSYLAVFACMFIIYQEKAKYFYYQVQQGVKP